MKIIGGNFGIKGKALLTSDNRLEIEGAHTSMYLPSQVNAVSASVEKERRFGFIGFIAGGLALGIAGWWYFGIAGAVVGVLFAFAGSFYQQKTNIVDMSFTDQKHVQLTCSGREVKKLIAFGNT